MTADELAIAVGVTRPYMSNIEAGRKPLPEKLVGKVATALVVPQIAILTARTPESIAS